MTRGLMKMQAKERAQKKNAKLNTPKHDQRAARDEQLKYKCPICLQLLSDIVVYKVHFEAKHPKAPVPPPELANA